VTRGVTASARLAADQAMTADRNELPYLVPRWEWQELARHFDEWMPSHNYRGEGENRLPGHGTSSPPCTSTRRRGGCCTKLAARVATTRAASQRVLRRSPSLAVLLALPFLPKLAERLQRILRERQLRETRRDSADVTLQRGVIGRTLAEQEHVMAWCASIAGSGSLALAGRAERALIGTRRELESALNRPVAAGLDRVHAALLCSLQLQSALEGTLRHVERLAEARVAEADPSGFPDLPQARANVLLTLQELLREAFAASIASLSRGEAQSLEDARAREIRLNAAEAQLHADVSSAGGRGSVKLDLALLEVAAAYESVGNQLYRLAQLCSEPMRPEPEADRAGHVAATPA
jgi:hypothetical protein